jgi:hypothetical protein
VAQQPIQHRHKRPAVNRFLDLEVEVDEEDEEEEGDEEEYGRGVSPFPLATILSNTPYQTSSSPSPAWRQMKM